MSRRTSVALGLAVFAAAGWTFLPMSTAHAETTYEAFAQANGFELAIANSSIPTGIAIEGGGPAAAVRQNNIGVADANAQFPYAGQTVPGLPGTGAALFGFPAPAYPFEASTNAGSAPSTVSYPGVTLHAESGDFTTLASSLVGQGALGANSTARVDESRNGDVTSTASTTADAIKLGPYATLSDVRSVATVLADGATGKVTRTTSTSIGRISVPGLAFEIPKQSPTQVPIPVPIPGVPNQAPFEFPPFPFPMGGETLHNPDIGIQDGYFTFTQISGGQKQTYTLPTKETLAAFSKAGYTISFQAPEETKSGIVSGTYRFVYEAPAPPPNTYYNGPTKFTQSTALVSAAVDLRPVEAVAPGPGLPLSDAIPPVPADTTTAAEPLARPRPSSDRRPLRRRWSRVRIPPLPPPRRPTPSPSAPPRRAWLAPVGSGEDQMFLTIVLIAGMGLIAATAISVLGVRS